MTPTCYTTNYLDPLEIIELWDKVSWEELRTINDGVTNRLQWLPPGRMTYNQAKEMRLHYQREQYFADIEIKWNKLIERKIDVETNT